MEDERIEDIETFLRGQHEDLGDSDYNMGPHTQTLAVSMALELLAEVKRLRG
jgi:hypothetical protein